MRPAAAQIIVERAGDFRACWRRIAVEQRLGRDQNPAKTISALAGLLLEKGLLQRMRGLRRAETFDGRHAAAGDACDCAPARFYWRAVEIGRAHVLTPVTCQ